MLEAVRSLLAASRISSGAVLTTLASAISQCEPALDAFLAFVPVGENLRCVASLGARAEHFVELCVRRDALEALPARAAREGHRVVDVEGAVIPTDRYAIAVPMHDRNGLHGIAYLSSAQSPLPVNEDEVVCLVEQATLPFTLAVEREADRADATFDGLTGLLTPRAFRSRLVAEIANRRFGSSPVVSLWFVDTDNFKAVNDTYGHAAGDAVLQTMASLLRAHTIPERDVVGRNGGDEFCALILDAQKAAAIDRAQAFCDAVRSYAFPAGVPLSASVGVASYPFDANDSSELLEVADAAMYHSKHNGRDRVSFALGATTFATYR
ncbi:MAG TPA: GGDEF domain-containing protein [Candidatus Baltobacteraceae bacterium]|nr:GGDEF domain-containing protein [Candidatus Baltobacteraceae bacterium]